MLIAQTCYNPYACKAVSDLSIAASQPPIILSPLNFESMYQQRQQQAELKDSQARDKQNVGEATVIQ